jgi:hypothetical protein
MKTLKAVASQKIVTWSLVVLFSFLQTVPTGWAATRPVPVDELQARSVPASVAALTNAPAATQAVPAPKKPVASLDSTVFLANNSPLSKAEPKTTPIYVGPPVKVDHTVTLIGPPVKVNDVPTLIGPPERAYDVKVITDPATGRELQVSIGEHGIATVKWGDQTYKGFFDPRTNSVTLVTNDNAVWTLQFGKNENGELSLQSFQSRQWSNGGYSEETYTYNPQGQLVRKDWLTEESFEILYALDQATPICLACSDRNHYRSGGTIDYVTINGKTLVSHEKTWSENGYELMGKTLETQSLLPYPSGRSETENWYSYDNEGNLLAKNWTTSDSLGGQSFGQEIYVHINGRDLVSVRRVWEYGMGGGWMYPLDDKTAGNMGTISIQPPYFGYASSHAETYYHYDAQGNLLAEVNAWERYDFQGTRQTGGSYWLRNESNNTWSFVSAEGINNLAIRSWADYGIIDAAAQRKTVYVGGNGERYDWKYRVEYTRDANGAMTAKAVYGLDGSVSIVRGEPDILSGEHNDIKFVNGQEVNGQRAYYQEYGHQDANGKWVSEGYRLVFYDQKTWKATAVDFPSQNTVELNGEQFKITLDKDGKLILDKIYVVPPTEQYVNELQRLLGKGFLVTLRMYRMGMPCKAGEACPDRTSYRIFIQRNPGVDMAAPRNLESMSFNISEDGKPDWSSLAVNYSGISEMDGRLLMEGVRQLLAQESTVCKDNTCSARIITDKEALVGMTKIVVTAAENGAITFEKNGELWKVTRDDKGNVILEKQLPPAVQQFINALQQQLGAAYSVKAYFVNGGFQVNIQLIEALTKAVREGQLTAIAFRLIGLEACPQGGSPSCKVSYVIDPESIQAGNYDNSFDGKLLYQALLQLPYLNGQSPERSSDPSEPGRLAILQMARLLVDQIDENGAIHFELDAQHYKAYRDENGNVQLEEELPPAVQAYVDELQKQLGVGYIVKAVFADGKYQVSITLNDKLGMPVKEGQLTSLSFNLNELGVCTNGVPPHCETSYVIDPSSLQATYSEKVDARLLFGGVRELLIRQNTVCNGQTCTARFITDQEVLGAMTTLTVSKVDENGAIHFTRDGKNYKTYRDEQGNVQLEEELPPAVQAYVDELQKQLGVGYIVKAVFVDGQYQVSVSLNDKLGMPVREGQLTSLSFNLNELGACTNGMSAHCWSSYVIDPGSLQATYSVTVDAKLLFEGMKLLQSGASDQEAVALMTKILVNSVDVKGVIHLTLDGKNYKAYRDEQGNVKLEAELPPAVQAIEAVIVTGLIKAFGFSKETLDQLIKDGKIVIKVDVENLTATITIDPSVQLASSIDQAGLVNLLGLSQLPGQITYELGSYVLQMGMPCPAGGPCSQAQPIYFLKAGHFSIGGRNFELSYMQDQGDFFPRIGDNRLRSVAVWQGPVCEPGRICPAYASRQIETLTFSYATDGSQDGAVRVEIRYLNVSENGVATRIVTIEQIQGQVAHIRSIVDLDSKGNVLANNEFVYRVVVPDCAPRADGPTSCGSPFAVLDHIARTDAQGKLLSTITVQGSSALIKLADGSSKEVQYVSAEQLLDLARQFEKENTVPPEVQAYVDLLKNLFKGYQVNVKFVPSSLCPPGVECIWAGEPEHWEITVFNPEQGTKAGELRELVIKIGAGATMGDVASVKYDGIEKVDAALLYGALRQLHSGLKAPGAAISEEMIFRLILEEMKELKVSTVDTDGAIHFTLEDKNYKAYREANGNVMLVEELFPSEILQAAQAGLSEAEWAQLNAAMLDKGSNSKYTHQVFDNGDQSWSWTSADGKTTYALVNSKIKLVNSDGSIQEIDRWSFAAETSAGADEVKDQLAHLDDPDARAQAEAALADGAVFLKVLSGADLVYQWRSVRDLDTTYILNRSVIHGVEYWNFSIQTRVIPSYSIPKLSQRSPVKGGWIGMGDDEEGKTQSGKIPAEALMAPLSFQQIGGGSESASFRGSSLSSSVSSSVLTPFAAEDEAFALTQEGASKSSAIFDFEKSGLFFADLFSSLTE